MTLEEYFNNLSPVKQGFTLLFADLLSKRINDSHIWCTFTLSLLQESATKTHDVDIINKVSKMIKEQTEESVKDTYDEYCKKLAKETTKDELKHIA